MLTELILTWLTVIIIILKEKLCQYLHLPHKKTDVWDVDSKLIVPIVISISGLVAKILNHGSKVYLQEAAVFVNRRLYYHKGFWLNLIKFKNISVIEVKNWDHT